VAALLDEDLGCLWSPTTLPSHSTRAYLSNELDLSPQTQRTVCIFHPDFPGKRRRSIEERRLHELEPRAPARGAENVRSARAAEVALDALAGCAGWLDVDHRLTGHDDVWDGDGDREGRD
jgi:hypothetical protein